jgi:hypothetical protein
MNSIILLNYFFSAPKLDRVGILTTKSMIFWRQIKSIIKFLVWTIFNKKYVMIINNKFGFHLISVLVRIETVKIVIRVSYQNSQTENPNPSIIY